MRIAPWAAAALVLAACAPKPETPEQTAARLKAESDSARVAIEAQDARIVKFIAAAEPDSVASIYAEDAVLYGKDMPATRGRAAIASQWRTWMAIGSYAYKVTIFSVEASGPIAIETGRSDVTFTPGPNAPRGTKAATFAVIYVTTWRKTGGQWLISRDIGTSDQPAQPTPAKRD
jgi:ketosteroid isomerase-like protein